MMTYTYNEDITARTIYGEARGEPEEGKVAVAWVIKNRATIARNTGRKQFGDGTPAGACRKPWQFSCWNSDDPNRPKLLALDQGFPDPTFADCLKIAVDVLAGRIPDPTNSATFYYDPDTTDTPTWAECLNPCAKIGRHVFFNNVG